MENKFSLFFALVHFLRRARMNTMEKTYNITESEWPIMLVLWERGSATAAEIVAEVTSGRDVSMRTIKTLLRRLIAKKAVAYAIDPDDSRIYHYRPIVSRDAAVRQKSRSFLAQVFQNRVSDLLVNFVQEGDLSDEEIKRLQDILKKKGGGRHM